MDQAEILARVDEVFGPEKGKRWLKSRPIAFGGKTPEEILEMPRGIEWIARVLSSLEYGGAA